MGKRCLSRVRDMLENSSFYAGFFNRFSTKPGNVIRTLTTQLRPDGRQMIKGMVIFIQNVVKKSVTTVWEKLKLFYLPTSSLGFTATKASRNGATKEAKQPVLRCFLFKKAINITLLLTRQRCRRKRNWDSASSLHIVKW